uniref:Integrase zinc-binding domain-containing protein n=1 Tax=Chara braunii TaxID=69332 RepID=A0A388KGF7_CHABU
MKVAADANGEWAKFKEEMQRRFKLGDGVLTKEDLEMLRRDEFSTVGAFATAFEKMAKKVPGLAEEEQCATFLGHFKNWEGSSLTKKVASGKKRTWAAIKEGVMDGELDQVDIFQMRQARKKRKALDATTSDGRDFKKIVEDAVAQLDAAKEARRKTMAAPQTTMENMDDLMDKIRRYQGKLVDLCEEVKEWQGQRPQVFMYGSGPKSQGATASIPNVSVTGGTPRSGMSFRPPSRSGRAAQAIRTRARGPANPEPPAKDIPGSSGEKEVVEPSVNEEEEDNRLRNEEDEKVEQRAKKRGVKADTEKAPEQKKKKYTVRVEEGFDVEEIMDRILEGHNHLMNLKDVLASAPRLFVLRVDPTALAGSLKNYAPSYPTIARWLTYIWMIDFELERIPGNKNRADGLSRVDWGKNSEGVIQDTPPVDGFLDKEEDVRLYINSWSLAAEVARNAGQDQERGENVIYEGEDDDFEEGEIKEAFRAEEYDGVYLELGTLLSCEMRERDVSEKVLKMRLSFLVRDGHLFMKSKGRNPRRLVCGIDRQIDVMAALHDGTAGGHRSTDTTYLKIHELYYWDGMGKMINDYCKSCVPCQERSSLRPREPLHPRYIREVGAVVHLDLLVMSLGMGGFDACDNLSGFVDGRAIRTKTGETLARCIEEYYLRYPFVSRFVMGRGSEFTSAEVKALLKRWDKMARLRKEPLRVGDTMLLYDSSLEKQWSRKFDKWWLGPYKVARVGEYGAYQIEKIDGTAWRDWVSGSRLKKFVARDEEIRAEVRRKNLEELHRKVEQGERPVDLKDRKGKSVSSQQEEDPRLLSEALENFDRLMGAARGPEGPQQEMGVKLVFADLLILKGVMKEGFVVARASDQKIVERLTKVAQKVYCQGVEWEQEVKELKKNQERQDRELDAMKVELKKVWVGNEAIRQWEKRIKELEAKLEQRAPTTLVDWTEVQGFEMKRSPAEEAFRSQKEEEKGDLQGGEDVPLLDKQMLQPQKMHMKGKAKSEEFEWQMPSTVTLQQVRRGLDVTQQAEVVRDEGALPIDRMVAEGQMIQGSKVEAEQGMGQETCEDSTMPQGTPLVANLEEALGSWATGSGSAVRASGPVRQTEEIAAFPTPSETPQQEVTSEVTAVPSSVLSQEEEKTTQKKPGKCFYCKKGKHFSDDCPKFYEDEARGFVTRVSTGIWRDRNGNLVERSCDGGRMQLCGQIGEGMID